jgi:hypothetical protein
MHLVDSSTPTMRCPGCGAVHQDFDGLGFIAHTRPVYADGCGWCSHPVQTNIWQLGSRCTLCGHVERLDEEGATGALRSHVNFIVRYAGSDAGDGAIRELVAEVRRLQRIEAAATACVTWTSRHDKGVCMHGVKNWECRACAPEPPHFPVGIDEFAELQAAVAQADAERRGIR